MTALWPLTKFPSSIFRHSSPAAANARASRALGEACREAGFFYIVGHGIDQALQSARGNVSQAARQLGISPRTLRYKLAKLKVGNDMPAMALARRCRDETG